MTTRESALAARLAESEAELVRSHFANTLVETQLAEATGVLREIDMRLERRSAIDGLTRLQAIELALKVCAETDPKGEIARRYVVLSRPAPPTSTHNHTGATGSDPSGLHPSQSSGAGDRQPNGQAGPPETTADPHHSSRPAAPTTEEKANG
ncbi:MAG: hypothetical protein Q8P41_31815 [Pseudomonadota bacterium]|nr:hypothetical protein [Pseudomonadota bacterium]